jgi:hypothetical protein
LDWYVCSSEWRIVGFAQTYGYGENEIASYSFGEVVEYGTSDDVLCGSFTSIIDTILVCVCILQIILHFSFLCIFVSMYHGLGN